MIIQSKPDLMLILEAINPMIENGEALLLIESEFKPLQERVKRLKEIKLQAISELKRMEIEIP